MGYKKDQNYFPETYRPRSSPGGRPPPPPLPPRASFANTPSCDVSPPPYDAATQNYHSQPLDYSWSAQDPRSTSTQSLVPDQHSVDDKRTLLLVYIHGFMGNDTSFQSFPAHVHNYVTVILADTHHVHTKIYPRYKSRKAIEHACEGFSKWLSPHESPKTDVILIGHSMGGILSAEVALLQSTNSYEKVFRHRLVGTINFDTPFLGMHPGVVFSGIGSIFRPAPSTPGGSTSEAGNQELKLEEAPSEASITSANMSQQQSITQLPSSHSSTTWLPAESGESGAYSPSPLTSPTNDPNYNPPFPNDVRMKTRTGWGNALHFINKHSDGLARATRSYVTSYFEFGGCMADYNGLKNRYSRLRSLEEADRRRRDGYRRVRFVNYYTASTGRPKKPKIPPRAQESEPNNNEASENQEGLQSPASEMQQLTVSESNEKTQLASSVASTEKCKAIGSDQATQDSHDGLLQLVNGQSVSREGSMSDSSQIMTVVDAAPTIDDEHQAPAERARPSTVTESNASSEHDVELAGVESKTDSIPADPGHEVSLSTITSLSSLPSLPPVPAQPEEPSPFDPSLYPEKDARKLAEKEHSRQTKAYERAVKDRDKAIKDRRKLLEKREKALKQAHDKQLKLEEKEIARSKKNAAKQEAEASNSLKSKGAAKASSESSRPLETDGIVDEEGKPEKVKKDKKFCMLPPKVNGEVDACWVRVFMRDVDEVGAHCGLFFVGEQYEWLVDDVGRRIQDWVLGG